MPNIANPFHNYVIHATFLNQVKAIKLALKLPKAQYLAPTQTTQVLYLLDLLLFQYLISLPPQEIIFPSHFMFFHILHLV